MNSETTLKTLILATLVCVSSVVQAQFNSETTVVSIKRSDNGTLERHCYKIDPTNPLNGVVTQCPNDLSIVSYVDMVVPNGRCQSMAQVMKHAGLSQDVACLGNGLVRSITRRDDVLKPDTNTKLNELRTKIRRSQSGQ